MRIISRRSHAVERVREEVLKGKRLSEELSLCVAEKMVKKRINNRHEIFIIFISKVDLERQDTEVNEL